MTIPIYKNRADLGCTMMPVESSVKNRKSEAVVFQPAKSIIFTKIIDFDMRMFFKTN